jgi:hypothetical protein
MDDLRLMLGGNYSKRTEETVQDIVVLTTVKLVADGFGVVVDNCHANPALPEKLRQALAGKVEWSVIDCSGVPVADCVVRDQGRLSTGGYVGAEVIGRLHTTMAYWQSRGYVLSAEWLADAFVPRRCVPAEDKPPAIIVGVDGTLAERGPFQRGRYTKKEFQQDVGLMVLDAAAGWGGAAIIVCSDRSEELRQETEDWLDAQGFQFDVLLMRPSDDMRSDTAVKAALFDAHVRGRYNVVAVFDDRDQVANGCWRAMGLRTYQPAGGAF